MGDEGHSLDHGLETDIVTGLPIEERAKREEERQLSELAFRQAKHEAILKDLRGKQGRLVVEMVHEALDRRVLELIQQDETARALMGVLQSLGAEIVATRQVRKRVENLQRLIEAS